MKINRKILSILLCLTLVLPLLTQAFVSSAANSTCYEPYSNISEYREGEHTYPVKSGYVFAGWYKYDSTKYVALSEAEADAATNAYAKFVDEDVLSIKYQLRTYETTLSDSAQIRMLTTVDSLSYDSVGFAITIGSQTVTTESDKVYQSIVGYVDGSGTAYKPSEFSESSNYFMAFTMTDIPNSVFANKMRIVPQWTTLDGTTVSGVARAFAMDEAMPNYATGIRFENDTDAGLFTGQGVEQDADIARVSYSNAGVPVPQYGENHGLKISHQSHAYPTFRIYFGNTVAAGTVITFQAYGTLSCEYAYSQSAIEPSVSGTATIGGDIDQYGQISHDGWKEITVTLANACSYIDLFWNMDRAVVTGTPSGALYIDNVRILGLLDPDIHEGIDFECVEHEAYVTQKIVNGNVAWNTCAVERVAYSSLSIGALEDGDTYAMKLTNSNSNWPALQINFGKELEAGTQVSFMAYGIIHGDTTNGKTKFEFIQASGAGMDIDAGSEFKLNEWSLITMTLPETTDRVYLCWNLDYAGGVVEGTETGELYIDNLGVVQPFELDITQGVDFEDAEETAYFTGQGAWNDATIERVDYADTTITPSDSSYGSYALRLSHESNYWPTFRINFGKELAAGTVISFQAYGRITSGTNLYNQSIFEYSAGGEATKQFKCDEWTELTITLASSCEHLDLYWNYDRASITSSKASGEVYIDNVVVEEPAEPVVLDITKGTGFEREGEEAYITPLAGNGNAVTSERVSYNDVTNVAAPADGENYALKLSGTNMWPTLTLNFGKELAAGTTISFWAYTIADNYVKDYTVFGYQGAYNNADASNGFNLNKWQLVEITLKDAASKLDLYWNMGPTYNDNSSIQVSAVMYIDNMLATEPVETDIYAGINFEYSEHEEYITQQTTGNNFTIERVDYATAGITQLSNGDSYVMKLSRSGFSWPTLQINFGKELPAGTKIIFNAYGKVTSGGASKNCKFEFNNGSGSGTAGNEFSLNEWSSVTITLPSAASYLQMFWNMECTGAGETATGELYIDNLIAVEPLVMDITQGTGFEKEGEEAYLTGMTGNGNSVVAEKVSYNNLTNVTAPTDGGSYAMKLSGSNMWPTLTFNFGKELAAGTTISFWAYTIVENYTNDYAVFGYQGGSYHGQDASNGFNLNKWQFVEITLKETSSTLNVYWNMAPAYPNDSVQASGVMYIDNMTAVEPIDICAGVDFETEEQETYITGLSGHGNTATVERVSYSDLTNVTAPTNGGSYAMKLSGSNMWPTLTLNFGKELAEGTTISFWAYTIADNYVKDYTEFGFQGGTYGGQTASNGFNLNQWQLVEITLKEATSKLDLYWNMGPTYNDDSSIQVSATMYIDNLIATEP